MFRQKQGNVAREGMIDKLHAMVDEPHRPCTYRNVLCKAYLAMAKSKKRPAQKMRSLVRVMLCAVKCNLAFVDAYLANGLALEDKRDVRSLCAMRKLYEQQKEMFDEKRHKVAARIVRITQPFVRPIVRGKAKASVEFGAKYDVRVDEQIRQACQVSRALMDLCCRQSPVTSCRALGVRVK